MTSTLTTAVQAIAALWFLVLAGGYLTLCALAVRGGLRMLTDTRRRRMGSAWLAQSANQPSVSVLVPAHNEEATIVAAVTSLLRQHWRHLEIIVVANGCTDRTVDALAQRWQLQPMFDTFERLPGARAQVRAAYVSQHDPRLRVIDLGPGGKSDALNCGLERASGEFVCMVDADSVLAVDAIARTMLPFVEQGERLIGVGSVVRVLNGATINDDGSVWPGLPTSRLARMQVVEYARAFHIGRAGWGEIGALPLISGAFGMFRASVLRAVGGLNTATVGEDLELILRLHSRVRGGLERGKLQFISEPLCWTEVPEDAATLRVQRERWQRGLAESIHMHRRMMLNERMGTLGLAALPFLGIFELFAPIIELAGIIVVALAAIFGILSWSTFAALLILSASFGVLLSAIAILLEQLVGGGFVARPRHIFTLLGLSVVEQFGHRQRTAWWRVRGLVSTLRGRRATWGDMPRGGHTVHASEVSGT